MPIKDLKIKFNKSAIEIKTDHYRLMKMFSSLRKLLKLIDKLNETAVDSKISKKPRKHIANMINWPFICSIKWVKGLS